MNDKIPQIRHVVLLCHPSPSSFTASLATAYCETVRSCGHQAVLRDLYAMGFDPVLKNSELPTADRAEYAADVGAELERIDGANIFVLVYPVWFAMPPAMLAGYIDRVFGAKATIDQVERNSCEGVLKDRHILSITTSSMREIRLDELGQIEALRDVTTRFLRAAFGMKSCKHVHFGGIDHDLTEDIAGHYLYDVEAEARRICLMLEEERS